MKPSFVYYRFIPANPLLRRNQSLHLAIRCREITSFNYKNIFSINSYSFKEIEGGDKKIWARSLCPNLM